MNTTLTFSVSNQAMKTLTAVLFCLAALTTAPLRADPTAIAEKLNGKWTAETGTFFKRGGKPPLDAKLVEELATDPKVTAIHFDACPVSLEVAQALAKSQTLKSLMIVHTDVGEHAKLKEIAKIQTLEVIHVGSSTFGDEGLTVLCELKNLTQLRLRHVSRDHEQPITAKGLKVVADKLPNLEMFLINLHRMEPEMITQLGRLQKLRSVMLEEVSPSFVAAVKKVIPNARITQTRLVAEDKTDPAPAKPEVAKPVDEADGSCSTPDEPLAGTAADEAVITKLLEAIIPGPPKRESGKDGAKLVWEKSPLFFRAALSKETGRVTAINANGVPMTNDRLRLLAQLKELRDLNYGHSGEWHFKDIPLSDFDGSGLEALADSKIESLHIGGSRFGKPGEHAIAKMKNLRRLTLRHLPLSEEGMTTIGKQPGLREFGIGLSHDMGRNTKLATVIPLVMANPNLQRLFIQEAFLKWDNGLSTIAEKGSNLEKIEFGRGTVVFPEDIDRLKKALLNAEIVTESYDRALHGNKFYESRLKAVMTKDEFARLVELAGK